MVKTVDVVGAVTGTYHTGTEMVVLKKGVAVPVSEAAAEWLEDRDLLRDDEADDDDALDADEAKAEIAVLRAEYKELAGKKAYGGWDAETLTEKIAELKGDDADDDGGDDAGDDEGEGQAPA